MSNRHAPLPIQLLAAGAIAIFASCTVQAQTTVQLLKDPGPGQTRAAILGRDPNGQPTSQCEDLMQGAGSDQPTGGANGSCGLYRMDTRAGWRFVDRDKTPGWGIVTRSGDGGANVIEMRNNSIGAGDPCRLHEVGISFEDRDDANASSFVRKADGTPYRMGDFKKVFVEFDMAVDVDNATQSTCDRNPSAYISADFRLNPREKINPGSPLRGLLIGTLIFGDEGKALNGKPSANGLYWSDGSNRVLVHGQAAVPRARFSNKTTASSSASLMPTADGGWKTYRIDVSASAAKWLTRVPPAALADSAIYGLDIYSDVRGARVDFRVRNIRVVGVN